ncbi:hypothetical protein N184_28995 [Sinorhizobium sp. GL28]|nr:hypothetical protein N184_28995 [Sinorhizobium sp. GL28]
MVSTYLLVDTSCLTALRFRRRAEIRAYDLLDFQAVAGLHALLFNTEEWGDDALRIDDLAAPHGDIPKGKVCPV